MKPIIKVPRPLMLASLKFGGRSVLGYDDHEKEMSRIYARPGIDKSVDKQTLGRAAECAFCLYMSLDPLIALDWSPNLDPGWDVVIRGSLIDVKGTDTEYLMWPLTKNGFDSKADLFVLVRRLHRPRGELTDEQIADLDEFEISGWITVKQFIAKHHSAPPPPWMDPDTKHLHMSEVREFTDATRAGYPNGYVGDSREGHFIHYCKCGAWASLSEKTALLKDQPGLWWCDVCYKEKQDASKSKDGEDRRHLEVGAGPSAP